ncbi:unnamed protein product [Rhizoctonia solani]|uniref:DUF6535 domain-containing protein n=1 Tax=Rhizoctonia solani TaxID=456999 RepID=A0A8H2X977_9AGAM|nr:unnamed protein product [Rhizoctonia solani]
MAFNYEAWTPDPEGRLPRIKISGFRLNPKSSDPKKHTKVEPGGFASYDRERYHHSGFARSKPQTRVAADRLGKELDPDGAIWELYQEESRSYDKELVENRDKSLDVILIYAGLFSSVLAGFLVDSKALLQQDTAAISMNLLLYIARSQNSQSNSLQLPPEPLTFTAPTTARLVNGLWFLALVISLTTALITMLAKEWIHAYIASQPPSPHAHALLHQARLNGLHKWHALHIIDLLPTTLHFALLLFLIGLVIYLRELDYLLANLVAAFSGATFLFYVATTTFSSISQFCPFATQVSGYIQHFLFKYPDWIAWADQSSKDAQNAERTTFGELRALEWLATHARDPAVAECTYQALAGLRTKSTGEADNALPSNPSPVSQEDFNLLENLFMDACAELPNLLVTEDREIPASRGMLISKHANALPRLVALLNTYSAHSPPEGILRSAARKVWDYITTIKPIKDNVTDLPLHGPGTDDRAGDSGAGTDQPEESDKSEGSARIKQALISIDKTRQEHSPYLTADAHSLLVVAELRLTKAQAEFHAPGQAKENELFDSRARYSRALFRVAVLLTSYTTGQISINADPLIALLGSLKESFECESLNPRDQYPTSTNHWQIPEEEKDRVYGPADIWAIIAGSYSFIYIAPMGIGDGDGLLVGLMQTIGKHDIRESYELAMAARKGLHAVAPVLLGQWFETAIVLQGSVLTRDSPSVQKSKELLNTWPRLEDDPKAAIYTQENKWTMKQLLILAQIGALFSEIEDCKMSHLSFVAVKTLCHLSMGVSGQFDATMAFLKNDVLLRELISSVIENYQYMHSTVQQLLQLLLPELEDHPFLSTENPLKIPICTDVECYPQMLKLWIRGADCPGEFQRLVTGLTDSRLYTGRDSRDALDLLLASSQLGDLVTLASRDKYSHVVLKNLKEWINNAFAPPSYSQTHSRWFEWPKNYSFPDFLGAVEFVLEKESSDDEKKTLLMSLMGASALYLDQPAETQTVRKILHLVEKYNNEQLNPGQHEGFILKCLEHRALPGSLPRADSNAERIGVVTPDD